MLTFTHCVQTFCLHHCTLVRNAACSLIVDLAALIALRVSHQIPLLPPLLSISGRWQQVAKSM